VEVESESESEQPVTTSDQFQSATNNQTIQSNQAMEDDMLTTQQQERPPQRKSGEGGVTSNRGDKALLERIRRPSLSFRAFTRFIVAIAELEDESVVVAADGVCEIRRWTKRRNCEEGGAIIEFVLEQTFKLDDEVQPNGLIGFDRRRFGSTNRYDSMQVWDIETGTCIQEVNRVCVPIIRLTFKLSDDSSLGICTGPCLHLFSMVNEPEGTASSYKSKVQLEHVGNLPECSKIVSMCEMAGGLLAGLNERTSIDLRVWDLSTRQLVKKAKLGETIQWSRDMSRHHIMEVYPGTLVDCTSACLTMWKDDKTTTMHELNEMLDSATKLVRKSPQEKEADRCVIVVGIRNHSIKGIDSRTGAEVFCCEPVNRRWTNSIKTCVTKCGSILCGLENGTVELWRTHAKYIATLSVDHLFVYLFFLPTNTNQFDRTLL